jgi:hypothetical protein
MTERPIIAVRFHTDVTLGNRPMPEWYADKPGSSQLAGKITARMGNAELGEQRTSVVFEVRLGSPNGNIDVEVPASNLAEIQREPPEAMPGAKASSKK